MLIRKITALLLVTMLVIALLAPLPGLSMSLLGTPSSGQFLLIVSVAPFKVPQEARPGAAWYLNYYRLKERQRGLVPLLDQFQAQGYIESFELLDPPNTVLVKSSLSKDALAAVLPRDIRVVEYDDKSLATATGELNNAASPGGPVRTLADSSRIVVGETANQVSGNIGMAVAETVTVTVQPPSGSSRSAFVMTTTSQQDGSYLVTAPTAPVEQDIAPGDIVTVKSASGTLNRSVQVPEPAITASLDLASNSVTGTKPEGSKLQIWLWDYVTKQFVSRETGSSGTTYTVSFAPLVLRRADYATANYVMPNGLDEVIVFTHPDFAQVLYHRYTTTSTDKVMGYSSPWSRISLTITSANGQQKFSGTVNTGKDGSYWWHARDQDPAVRIEPNDTIAVSGREAMQVEAVGASALLDPTADVITATFSSLSGTQAGRLVRMMINDYEHATRDGTTDSGGVVTIDFTTNDPSGSDVDVNYGDILTAYYNDPNGNQTVAVIRLDAPTPTPTPVPTLSNKLFLPIIQKFSQ